MKILVLLLVFLSLGNNLLAEEEISEDKDGTYLESLWMNNILAADERDNEEDTDQMDLSERGRDEMDQELEKKRTESFNDFLDVLMEEDDKDKNTNEVAAASGHSTTSQWRRCVRTVYRCKNPSHYKRYYQRYYSRYYARWYKRYYVRVFSRRYHRYYKRYYGRYYGRKLRGHKRKLARKYHKRYNKYYHRLWKRYHSKRYRRYYKRFYKRYYNKRRCKKRCKRVAIQHTSAYKYSQIYTYICAKLTIQIKYVRIRMIISLKRRQYMIKGEEKLLV